MIEMTSEALEIGASRVARVVADIAARNGISRPIGPDEGLVDIGLSSIAMVDLMLAIEAAFDIMIPQQDLVAENFRSIASIEGLMARLVPVAA